MNTKHPLYKEMLKVEREIDALYEIKWNQNYVQLEKPYKSGYYKTFDLRDDIKNRSDAWVFYKCIELAATTVWCKDKTFKSKYRKGKFEDIRPGFATISENVYRFLGPAVKKYFTKLNYYDKGWTPYRDYYKCNAPSYFFVDKITPRWITHYKEHDSVLEIQINEKRDYLNSKKFWNVHNWRGYSCAPKSFREAYTRSDRRHSKQTVKKNIIKGDEYEYRYGHRHSARWDYW